MKHRLFAALPISQKLQADIFEWERAYARLPVRWLDGRNLHITLIPPWYEDSPEGAARALRNIKENTRRIDLRFTKAMYGPNPKSPRLVWAEGETPATLLDLKDKLERVLGAPPERRAFKTHLTLARFPEERFSSFATKHLDEQVDWRETAASFVLMESHLSGAGADHEIIEEFPLAG